MGRVITVLAKASAQMNKVERVDDTTFRIFTTEPSEKNKANEAITKLLAEELDVAPSTLTLVRGKKSRLKKFTTAADA
ncbi:MAG: DUF167 domain-containing protein [Patescibacteria group bacterium]|jgi:uncharacterized protein YggU (UPF0235/DUF167 family)